MLNNAMAFDWPDKCASKPKGPKSLVFGDRLVYRYLQSRGVQEEPLTWFGKHDAASV